MGISPKQRILLQRAIATYHDISVFNLVCIFMAFTSRPQEYVQIWSKGLRFVQPVG